MDEQQPSYIEYAYASLANSLLEASREGTKDRVDRIYSAIQLFEELWPEDCERWRERARSKMSANQ